MLTLIGTVVGFIPGLITGWLEYKNKELDQKHELALLDAKTKQAEALATLEIDKINVMADAKEGDSIRRHDSTLGGGEFIQSLRASVRPVITYCFFFLFVAIQLLVVFDQLNRGAPLLGALTIIWNTEVSAIFATILAFWFGDRTMQKMRLRNDPLLSGGTGGLY